MEPWPVLGGIVREDVVHEFGIAAELLEAAQAEADRLAEGKLMVIGARLGSGAGISAEALQSSFEMLVSDLGLEPLALELEQVGDLRHCGCGEEFRADDHLATCPACGGIPEPPPGGVGLEIDYLRVADS